MVAQVEMQRYIADCADGPALIILSDLDSVLLSSF